MKWLSRLFGWALMLAVAAGGLINPMFYQLQSASPELIEGWIRALMATYPAVLIAFLDDASRLLCHGQFFFEENRPAQNAAHKLAHYKSRSTAGQSLGPTQR
jgi:hypothetical protein